MNRDEILKTVGKQRNMALRTGMIQCPCEAKVQVMDSFRCYYCGVYYCPACAPNHFGGKRREIHIEETRYGVNILSDGDIVLAPDGTVGILRDTISVRRTSIEGSDGQLVPIGDEGRYELLRVVETSKQSTRRRLKQIVEMYGATRVSPKTTTKWKMPPAPSCPTCDNPAHASAYNDGGEWYLCFWCSTCDDVVSENIDWPFEYHDKAWSIDLERLGFDTSIS